MKINVKRILAEQAKQKKSNAEICDLLSIPRTRYSSILRAGACQVVTLGRIADALGVDPGELIL